MTPRRPSLIPFFILILSFLSSKAIAVEFRTETIAGKPATICQVDLRKERLQLFLRDDAGQPIKQFSRLESILKARGEKLVFAMNGGMYHSDFSPVGIFIADGKQVSPLNVSKGDGNFFLKPNGVFVITESGARIVETSQYPGIKERVILATQSGPMLVHACRIHPSFRANSDSRLHRNGICAPTPDTVIFVITEAPVNLYEFAKFFRDNLHCTEALFLDGTVSSLYATELRRNDFRMDLGPILGVTEQEKRRVP